MADTMFEPNFYNSANESSANNPTTILNTNRKIFGIRNDIFDGDNFIDTDDAKNVANDDDNEALINELQLMKHYVVEFDQLIQLTGFMNLDKNFYQQLCSIYPLVANEDNGDDGHLTVEEKKLANIFKCDALHEQCYFSTNEELTFRNHLKNVHPNWKIFSCFYCVSKSDKHEHCSNQANSFDDVTDLIDHIVNQHMTQMKYQCNLCFYRAFSSNHILIHQALEHSKSFFETIKRLVLDKGDDYSNLLEQSFRMYFNDSKSDDETEIIENEYDDSSKNNLCKIIECWSVKDDHFDVLNYFEKNGCHTEYKNLADFENYPLHCAYCNDTNFQSNCSFWTHFISFHPEHAIIGYFVQMASLGDETSNNIQEFKFLIDQYSLPRSYNEKMMNDAFNYYRNDEQLSSGKRGLKRKQNEDDNDNDDEIDLQTATSSIVQGTKTGSGRDEIDCPNKTSNKRFRGNWFNGQRILTRTRTVFGLATTVFFALGFYHFNQYLPKSLYEFLNNN